MKRVQMRWVDSLTLHHGEWAEKDEHLESLDEKWLTHETIGFLVGENEHGLVVASSVSPDEVRFAGAIAIPHVAVIKRWELK